jgi:predicted HicB family RNase H-like nuclease
MIKRATKILTGFRLDPELKLLAVKAAAQENRTLSNYIESLIRRDVEAKGLISPVGSKV